MCGIVGQIHWQDAVLPNETIKASEKLIHRGPDGMGFVSYHFNQSEFTISEQPPELPAHLHFAHRRLSIIDPLAGFQPMMSSCRRYAIIFNGEIYNYLELKKECETEGYQFQTHSDTEVLLAVYQLWGIQGVNQCIGMYAFAILDLNTSQCTLARDPFGIKPLYFANTDAGFYFASEIKALKVFKHISQKADPDTLLQFLNHGQCDFPNQTFFQDMQPVPPGCYIQIDLQEQHVHTPTPFWQLQLSSNNIGYDEAKAQLQTMMKNNIALHLRSDVPVAAALSGGIDSSIICALTTQYQSLETFSYIDSTPEFDESRWINDVTKMYRLDNHSLNISQDTLLQSMSKVVACQDEPFGSPSILAQFHVFEKIHQQGFKVSLSGQGADEIFAGYRRYLKGRYHEHKQLHWLQGFLFSLKALIHNRMLSYHQLKQIQAQLHMSANPYIQNTWFPDAGNNHVSHKEADLKSMLKHDIEHHLLSLLRYEDRNAMTHSVESRVPYLTPDLVTFVLSLPSEYLIDKHGRAKCILRDTFDDLLPHSVKSRRDKIGFKVGHKVAAKVQHQLHADMEAQIRDLPFIQHAKLPKHKLSLKHLLNDKFLWRTWQLGHLTEIKY